MQESHPELFKSFKAKVCALTPRKGQFSNDLGGSVASFKLSFPEDIQLLTILAPALISWFESNQDIEFFGEPSLTEEKILLAVLSGYGLSPTQLRDIAESSSYEKTVRANALSLYWPLQNEIEIQLDLIHEKELYVELINEINEVWLTQALVRGVLVRHSETDLDALAFVSLLMKRCHNGGDTCNELVELIGNWRERSTAPVHSKDVLKKWLGCDSEIPLYANE